MQVNHKTPYFPICESDLGINSKNIRCSTLYTLNLHSKSHQILRAHQLIVFRPLQLIVISFEVYYMRIMSIISIDAAAILEVSQDMLIWNFHDLVFAAHDPHSLHSCAPLAKGPQTRCMITEEKLTHNHML